jgi:hypothetical protein
MMMLPRSLWRIGSGWDAIRMMEPRDNGAMTEDENRAADTHPVLLCFDGSNDAATATVAGRQSLVTDQNLHRDALPVAV